MKKIISNLVLLLPILAFSQSNFEGTITYRVHESREAVTYDIKMYYGKNKLKMIISGQSKEDYPDDADKIMLFDFEKGVCYMIDTIAKTFEIDSLKLAGDDDAGFDFSPTDSFKIIQGYNCRLYKPKKPKDLNFDYFKSENDLSIWFAEDVKYIIPKEYINKRSLIATDDGNTIWTKFSFIIGMSYGDKMVTDTITTELIKIDKQILPDAVFNIPPEYSLKLSGYDSTTGTIELAEIISEEVIKPEPPPPPPPKETKPLKSPAQKTKQTKPVKG